jgi:hypothetical protein
LHRALSASEHLKDGFAREVSSIRCLLSACFFDDQTGDVRGQLQEVAEELETADIRWEVTEIVDNAAQLAGDI